MSECRDRRGQDVQPHIYIISLEPPNQTIYFCKEYFNYTYLVSFNYITILYCNLA